jgi:two-component SAPR family response regulator
MQKKLGARTASRRFNSEPSGLLEVSKVEKEREMVDKNAFGGSRVLVVEDDLLVVADLVDTLHAMGADVIGPIENLDKAIERLDKLNGIVGAVLDVSVQGQFVFPLADELMRRRIPFVFATGYDESVVPERYSRISRFSKPANDRDVADALLNAIQST